MANSADFSSLKDHRYVSLTTFRKTGKPVATPVWFAGDARRIYVWTNAGSGKVKRLKNNPKITLAPCTYNGKVLGPEIGGTAEILRDSQEEEQLAERSLRAKYGWQWRIGRFFSGALRRHSVFLRIKAAS
ncbi:MAG TPA: PPOX class F420-dependent oxidoreductase [Acidobacteriota bacterium]|nr:PPOX class F420-dependent oxidoreductase [Acidobacteriota bacterium]